MLFLLIHVLAMVYICNHNSSCVSSLSEGIWSAAIYGDLERLKLLVQKGSDPNLRDSAGYTALVSLF